MGSHLWDLSLPLTSRPTTLICSAITTAQKVQASACLLCGPQEPCWAMIFIMAVFKEIGESIHTGSFLTIAYHYNDLKTGTYG